MQALNAIFGLGASGLDDHAVAANATVALLVTSTVAALFVTGPAFNRLGPRACVLLGGWTYPLYIGSLMAYARMSLSLSPSPSLSLVSSPMGH